MELASPQVHKSGNSLHVSHGDDKGLFVSFYNESVEMPFKSEQAGHKVYEDVPFIHIVFPGNNTTQVRKPAKLDSSNGVPSDPERFPKQWAAFKAQAEVVQEGFPLTEWPVISKSLALTMKAMQIHTVEQLANIPDTALTMRLTSANENLQIEIEAMKKQMAEIASLQKSQKGNK